MGSTKLERQELLKGMIKRLHAGDEFEVVKAQFIEEFEGVDASEIADLEKALVAEGAVKIEEIQKLCDVHAALFTGSVNPTDKDRSADEGHPTWILRQENRALERLFADRIDINAKALEAGDKTALAKLEADFNDLWQIDLHYSKKENLWFPIMERYGITAPPQVMWGVDDEIRAQIKELRALLKELQTNFEGVKTFLTKLEAAKVKIIDMISKEENILIPMVSEVFFLTDWRQIKEQSSEIGYCLMDDHPTWKAPEATILSKTKMEEGTVNFPTGSLSPLVLNQMLNTLPIDITFVDADDKVAYFSQAAERIFARTTTVIGREVKNCHPPASVHVVEQILNDFKTKKRDSAEFYIHLGEMYVLIRFYAVRDEQGTYLGTLEVAQNIAPIQKISGDKRLLDE